MESRASPFAPPPVQLATAALLPFAVTVLLLAALGCCRCDAFAAIAELAAGASHCCCLKPLPLLLQLAVEVVVVLLLLAAALAIVVALALVAVPAG